MTREVDLNDLPSGYGTGIEGSWDEVMSAIKACHEAGRSPFSFSSATSWPIHPANDEFICNWFDQSIRWVVLVSPQVCCFVAALSHHTNGIIILYYHSDIRIGTRLDKPSSLETKVQSVEQHLSESGLNK